MCREKRRSGRDGKKQREQDRGGQGCRLGNAGQLNREKEKETPMGSEKRPRSLPQRRAVPSASKKKEDHSWKKKSPQTVPYPSSSLRSMVIPLLRKRIQGILEFVCQPSDPGGRVPLERTPSHGGRCLLEGVSSVDSKIREGSRPGEHAPEGRIIHLKDGPSLRDLKEGNRQTSVFVKKKKELTSQKQKKKTHLHPSKRLFFT